MSEPPNPLDAIYGLVVAALDPEIPETRVYADARDPGETALPVCWLHMGDTLPGLRHFEEREIVYVELWAESQGELLALERRLAWLSGLYSPPDKRYGRKPTRVRAREPDAWHSRTAYPVTVLDPAATGRAVVPDV